MQVRPITPRLLVDELADRVEALGRWPRVAIDGAPQAGTGELAEALVEPLRLRGREVVHVRASDFLRPASLRLEHGRRDPDAYYEQWFDLDGIRREVLNPLGDGGSGAVLPALWDPETDRSPRLDRVELGERGLVILDGPFLLGAGLPFEFTVHLWLPGTSLDRHAGDEHAWKSPAFHRYSAEVGPERLVDYLVRSDRRGHPAVVDGLD
jgi:hypothetical protein